MTPNRLELLTENAMIGKSFFEINYFTCPVCHAHKKSIYKNGIIKKGFDGVGFSFHENLEACSTCIIDMMFDESAPCAT